MIKAVIYARVSSKEQEKTGYSIPAQLKLLRNYAAENHITVDQEFIDTETAKKSGRTNFNRMLKYLKESGVGIVLVEKTDRLYRNFKDYVTIDEIELEIHLVKENQILSRNSKSHEKFIHGIKVLMAKNYIDNLSEEIRKGQREALLSGRWIYSPPYGYSFKKENGKSVIIQNNRACIIKFIFEALATGTTSQADLIRKIHKKFGVKFARQSFSTMIRNPIYYGMMRAETSFPGELFKGNHEPIISQKLFQKVQDILSGKKKKINSHTRENKDFPLRGYVYCEKCGNQMTASWATGRNQRYAYYWCQHGCKTNVRKEKLEDLFVEKLQAMEPKAELMDLFEAIFTDVWQNNQKTQIKFNSNLNSQLEKAKKRKSRITELLIDGTLEREMYAEKMSEVTAEIERLNLELNSLDDDRKILEDNITFAKLVLENLSKYWRLIDQIQFRRRLQNLIFPAGFFWNGERIRTADKLSVFNYLDQIDVHNELNLEPRTNRLNRTAVTDFKINELGANNEGVVPFGAEGGTRTPTSVLLIRP
jgi:site-specific DNA recombinase